MALLQDVVTAVRTVRSEWGVPPAQRIDVLAHGLDPAAATMLRPHLSHVRRLAGLAAFDVADEAPRADPDTVRRVVRGFELHVPLAGIVDRTKEADRVAREPRQADEAARRVAGAAGEPGVPGAPRLRTSFATRAIRRWRPDAGRRSWSVSSRSSRHDGRGLRAARPRRLQDIVRRALAEDLHGGDVTSEATVARGQRGRGELARQTGMRAGRNRSRGRGVSPVRPAGRGETGALRRRVVRGG